MKTLILISLVLLSFGCKSHKPKTIEDFIARGEGLYSEQEYEKALDDFEEVMVIDPYNQIAINYI